MLAVVNQSPRSLLKQTSRAFLASDVIFIGVPLQNWPREIDTNDQMRRLYLLIRICLALWNEAVTSDLVSGVCNSVCNRVCLSLTPQTDRGLD